MLNRLSVTIIGLLGLLSTPVYCQKILVGLDVGYATFAMRNLKSFQEDLSRQYPVDTRVVESFPGYLNYSLDIRFMFEKFYTSAVAGHTSTGGRISYADYSGAFSSDQLVQMNYIGYMVARKLTGNESFNLFLGCNILYYSNKVNFREKIQLSTETVTNETELKSRNFATGPYFELQKKINRMILRALVGSEIHIAGPLSRDRRSNYALVDSGNDEVNVQASGLRLNLGVAYSISEK